jgi:DMATS type aromatic prenyltransferase
MIRFIFQPQYYGAGIAEELKSDMTWCSKLSAVFSATEDEKTILKAKLPQLASIPQCLLGFDLHENRQSMKAYFGPLLRNILTGEDTDDLVFRTLLDMDEGFKTAIELLSTFRSSQPSIRKIDVVGVDCIPPADGARIKLYARLTPGVNNFKYVENNLTLGGRLANEAIRSQVDYLRGIWHILLHEPAGWTETGKDKPEIGPVDPHSGIMISWEIQPGKNEPVPKLYVPQWKFSTSNRAIANQYAEIFKQWEWGWKDGDQYKSVIKSAL